MDLPIDGMPVAGEPARRGWLSVLLITLAGIGLGCGAAVAFLLWWDHQRWQEWERERLLSLSEQDIRAKAAHERELANARKDALGRFNDQFREIYRIVRAEALVSASPIVVASGDELILIHKDTRLPITYIPATYHDLKAVAHLPLAAYLVTGLEPGNTELPASRQFELKKLLDRLPDLREDLGRRDFSPDALVRQIRIIDATEAFLKECHQRAYEKKPINPQERAQFAESLRQPIEENVLDAARLQIEALDKQMTKWRKELSESEWNKLRVVVIGSAMPRRDNLAVQYFAWLLGESGEGERIIYAEGLFDEDRALNLLGTHLVDRDIGRQFFREPSRMQRDLLGDAARKILEDMTRTRAAPQ